MELLGILVLLLFSKSKADTSHNVLKSRINHFIELAAHDLLKSYTNNQHSSSDNIDLLPIESSLHFLSNNETHELLREKRSIPLTTPHSNASHGYLNIPEINVSAQDFAHHYISQTGVGNREELSLSSIEDHPLRLSVTSPPLSWKTSRFNSSDYLMSIHRDRVHVWNMIRPLEQHFDQRYALCSLLEGEVVLSDFHSRMIHHYEVLRISLVVLTPHSGYQLKTFEVTDSGCIPLTVFQLKNKPKKLIVVSSVYESSVVILSEGQSREATIEFKQVIRDSTSRVIEVSISHALHLTSFTISGHPYLAIGHRSGVEIGRLNELLNHYMTFDAIPIRDVTDIQTFQMGFSLYMGVTTSGYAQHLFEWKRSSFRLKQTFPVTRVAALKLVPVPSCRDDMLLLFMRFDRHHPLLIYSWSGSREEFVMTTDDVRKFGVSFNYDVIPESVCTFAFNRSGVMMSMDTQGRPHALTFKTILIPVTDPVYVQTLKTTEMMKNLRDRLMHQESFIDRLRLLVNSAIKSTELPTLSHYHVLQNLAIMKPSVIRTFAELKRVTVQGAPMTLQDLLVRTKDLNNVAHLLLKTLKQFESVMKHIAFRNQPTIMSGANILEAADAFILNVSHTRLAYVADLNVKQAFSGIFQMKGTARPIQARKFFSDLTVLRGVRGLINEIDISGAVTVTSHNLITGHLSINNLNVQGDFFARDINGIDLTRDVIGLDRGVYFVQQPVIFVSPVLLIFGLVTPKLSSVDVSFFKNNVMLTTDNQEVRSAIILSSRTSFSSNIKPNRVNGFDIIRVAADLVRIDQECVIVAPKQFLTPELLIRHSLNVNRTLNGISVPRDIFLTNIPQDVPSFKRFIGHHTFVEDVVVHQLVDGILLHTVVTLTKSEEVSPLVFSKGVDVFGSIEGVRSVDGVDLRLLDHIAMKGGQEGGKLSSPVFAGPVIVRGLFKVNGQVNNIKINALASDTVYVNTPCNIIGSKTFTRGIISPKGIRTRSINRIDIDAISRTTVPESISRLVLRQPLFRNLMVKDAMINGINLMTLNLQRISLREPGFIAGGKRFVQQLRTNTVVVNGTIHDLIPRRDLTTKSMNGQAILAPKILKNIKFEGLVKVAGKLRGRLFDGINVTRLSYHRVTLHSQQVMRMSALLVDSATDFLFAPVFNHYDLGSFLPNVLLVNGMRQVITGNKTFVHPVEVINEVESLTGVNRIRLQEVDDRAVKLHGITVIDAPFHFDNSLSASQVSCYGHINGININLFAAEALFKKNGEAVVSGNNIFARGFKVNSNLDALKINGLHLPSSIFLRVGHQTLFGNIQFTGVAVQAKRDVRVGKSVGGIRLFDFQQRIMRSNVPSIVNADLLFQDPIHVRGSVRVGGRVSGVKLNHLHRNTLYKVYDQFIPGEKMLTAPAVVASDLNLMTLNNVSFEDIINDLVFLKSRTPTILLRPKVLSNIVIFHRNVNSMTQQTRVSGRIRGIDLDDLTSNIVFTDRINFVHGIKKFHDPIAFAGNFSPKEKVNSISLLDDVFFLIHPQGLHQIISAPKSFGRIRSDASIEVMGLVNGLDLKAEASDSLYLNGDQRITGRKDFNSPLILSDVITSSSQPNLNQVALLSGDNFIVGTIAFTRPILVHSNTHVYGRVNKKILLSDLLTFSLNKNNHQLVQGPLTFDQTVFFGNVSTRGPVNRVPLNRFAHDVFGFKQRVYLQEKAIDSSMVSQMKKSRYTFDLLLDNPFTVDSFILRQELPGIRGNHYELQGDGLFSMSQLDPQEVNSTTYQMRFKRYDGGFETKRVEVNVPFIKRVNFKLQGTSFSVVRFPSSDQIITQVRMNDRTIGTLDQYVDSLTVITRERSSAYIALLIGIHGHIKVYFLGYTDRRVSLSPISILNVGASATKMNLFIIDKTLYLAVARSFRGQCSVSDYGSLLFQLQGTSFKLIQRIPVSDSHHVVYYESNGQHYLAFSELGDASAESSTQSIHVFKKKEVSGCHFVLFQTLPFDNLRDLNVVSYGSVSRPQLFLTGVNSTAISVWRQDGYSGFRDSWVMRVNGGESVQPVFVKNHGLFFIVSQSQRCRGSLVFEAKSVGSTLLTIRMRNSWKTIT